MCTRRRTLLKITQLSWYGQARTLRVFRALRPSQTSARRSTSPASSYQDLDDEEGPVIDRHRLRPDQARSQFSSAQVDARDVEFSDRVDGKQRSYKASSRRRRRLKDGTEELGDLSDEEDESLERKLARLHREAEELKAEYSVRQAEKDKVTETDAGDGDKDAIRNSVESLSRILDGINTSANGTGMGAYAELSKMLGRTAQVHGNGTTQINGSSNATEKQAGTRPVTYPPSHPQSHALTKAADFDTRLTTLEKTLGIGSSCISNFDQVPTKAVLPTLDILDKQISTLSSLSPSSLDATSRKVRQLTQEAEKLDEARKSAKAAQDALKADPSSPRTADEPSKQIIGLENPEQVSKINALYGTLATIENLSPLLPSILDRLRSLRAIHANAATAAESLDQIEKRQEEMAAEIKQWREGLEKVEGVMAEGEETMGQNMKVVEGWVKGLESRIEKFT